MKKMNFGKGFRKRGIVTDYLPWILIAVAVLVIMLIASFILKEKGFDLIDKLKDFFSFGK